MSLSAQGEKKCQTCFVLHILVTVSFAYCLYLNFERRFRPFSTQSGVFSLEALSCILNLFCFPRATPSQKLPRYWIFIWSLVRILFFLLPVTSEVARWSHTLTETQTAMQEKTFFFSLPTIFVSWDEHHSHQREREVKERPPKKGSEPADQKNTSQPQVLSSPFYARECPNSAPRRTSSHCLCTATFKVDLSTSLHKWPSRL